LADAAFAVFYFPVLFFAVALFAGAARVGATGLLQRLAGVQRLVDLQHGTVAIASQVQVGTAVTIQLPLAP
jgi:signal transduction histidine kinase